MTQKREKNRSRQQAREIAFSCLCSFVLLLFCTRSSPLYPFNNWDDANSYFSMGKGMMNGMVPYRDLFDQKGILLYFLYGLAYLLSHTTFLGVFVLEVAAAALHLWAALKISLLLCERSGAAKPGRFGADAGGSRLLCFLFLPIYGACVYSARCVWYGGSAEELMLPLFVWGLWLLFRVLGLEGAAGLRQAARLILLAGFLAGCVLHIKFNSLGFFFGWMAAVFFCRLRADGLKRSLLHGLLFLCGMGAATLPWLFYFLLHGAVRDWFRVTIYLNLFVYSEKLPFAGRVYTVSKTLYFHFLDNPGAFVPAAAGVLWLLLSRRARAAEKASVFATGFFLALGIFIGGVSLPYYPLPLAVYALFAIPAAALSAGYVGELLRAWVRRGRGDDAENRRAPGCAFGRAAGMLLGAAAAVICCAALFLRFSMNRVWLGTKREALWQVRFCDDILASDVAHPTLLNMNCFDAGLYCLADIVPSCYFFQTQTIRLEGEESVYHVQRENLRRGDTDFVLAREYYPEGIEEHYVEIDRASADYFGTEQVYYLFRKKDR